MFCNIYFDFLHVGWEKGLGLHSRWEKEERALSQTFPKTSVASQIVGCFLFDKMFGRLRR